MRGSTRKENYLTVELCLNASDAEDNGLHERKKTGDIIAVRVGATETGSKVKSDVLFVMVEGVPESMLPKLTQCLMDPLDPPDTVSPIYYDKRRYCVPLNRLSSLAPFVDLNRVKDVNDIYQPWRGIDEDTNHFLDTGKPALRFEGLILDKATGKYL